MFRAPSAAFAKSQAPWQCPPAELYTNIRRASSTTFAKQEPPSCAIQPALMRATLLAITALQGSRTPQPTQHHERLNLRSEPPAWHCRLTLFNQ
eukprot:4547841-Alexandrium_andersonii.AAC.1